MKNYMKVLSVMSALTIAVGSAAIVRGEYDPNNIKVTLDGKSIEFDVPPQIVDERTMVPVRAIFEALGAEVDWDQDTATVTAERNGRVITLVIGDNTMTVDGTAHELDVPPQIVDERTLVPVRAISESFGCAVEWDGETGTVIITSDSEPSISPFAPGPAIQVTEEPTATETPAATGTPTETATASPTAAATTAPTLASTAAPTSASEIPIEYDKTNETKSENVSQFKITECTKTDDGKYAITYYLETFFEGRGTVTATFNCYNAAGKIVDTFGGSFSCVDYTWTKQTGTAEISADTVKIELSAGNSK